MYIKRKASDLLKMKVAPGKVTVILGPRRVGKTFMLKEYVKENNAKTLFFNGEDFAIHELLKRRSVQNYKNLLGDSELLIIDEAQKVPEIGSILKLIVDSFDKLKIVVTGSSAFDIYNLAGEPLTGRKYEIRLFPISEEEIIKIETVEQRKDNPKKFIRNVPLNISGIAVGRPENRDIFLLQATKI
ncbi:MAG: AAA family ATPase [Bacteroidota bacterium]